MDWQSVVLGLIGGGLVSAVAQVIAARSTAKKSDVDALRGIIDELRSENTRLKKRQEEDGKRIDELERENETLRKKLGMSSDGRTKGLFLDR